MRAKIISMVTLLCSFSVRAALPVDDFDAFMTDNMRDFDTFITEANRDFINFMRSPWKKYQGEEPIQKHVIPEPVEAPVCDPESQQYKEPPRRLTIKEILDISGKEGSQGKTVAAEQPTGTPIPQPREPVADKTPSKPEKRKPVTTVVRDTVKAVRPQLPETPAGIPAGQPEASAVTEPSKPASSPLYSGGAGRCKVTFGGVDYYVDGSLKNSITLHSLTENSVADALERLYGSDTSKLLADLRTLRKNDLKNDWALFLFIKQLSEQFAGKNESVVIRQFLLNSLGFRARIARVSNPSGLVLMIATSVQLYGCLYIDERGTRFYDIEATQPYSFQMCSKEAPGAKSKIDMRMDDLPRVAGNIKTATHTYTRHNTRATVSVPVKLMDFYNNIPQCDYSVYATAKVDNGVANDLLPSLRASIAGKSEKDAAGILLDFCQNGFKYATDPEQFGYEKPFFVEELFYYPYCDCEDRSILYRYLVKNLLGLDVVLLDYPNHIATGVRFASDYPGDYVMVNGAKYLVCDPTYMGAPIGKAMPQFKNTAAKVLRF